MPRAEGTPSRPNKPRPVVQRCLGGSGADSEPKSYGRHPEEDELPERDKAQYEGGESHQDEGDTDRPHVPTSRYLMGTGIRRLGKRHPGLELALPLGFILGRQTDPHAKQPP